MATLLTNDPDSIFTNYLMALLYIKDKSYDRAAVFSRSLINNFPELWIGYELLGDSWKGMGFLDKALYCYKTAIGKTNSDRTQISKKIGLVYLEQKNYSNAYRNLKKGVEVYASEAKPDDLYSLALAAIHTKRTKEASDLLEYAVAKLPPEETELAKKISRAKELISDDNNQ
jgi:tetratricopeptide (TPR) repeat protein